MNYSHIKNFFHAAALHIEYFSGHTGLTTGNTEPQMFCMTRCRLLQFLQENLRAHTVNHTNVHFSFFLSFNFTITFYSEKFINSSGSRPEYSGCAHGGITPYNSAPSTRGGYRKSVITQ